MQHALAVSTTLLALACAGLASQVEAEQREETEVKFAFYSSAWGENTDDGLRLIAFNQRAVPIRLNSIQLHSDAGQTEPVTVNIDLEVPAGGYAGKEFDYIDLLSGDECIARTLEENWKLVEVSNYTLNPSVRNLIIEDTDSFRIYQCVLTVSTSWTDLGNDSLNEYDEWVLFHFETRRNL